MSILIIDSVMGSGKSNWAINQIKSSTKPIMYVTPYLEEVDRFKKEVTHIYEPHTNSLKGENKTVGLMKLLEMGLNIATTHSLFSIITNDMIKLIKSKGYELILDEVVEGYRTYPMTRQDYGFLRNNNHICVDEDTLKVSVNSDVKSRYIKSEAFARGLFYEFITYVESGMVYEYNNTPIIEYPVHLFKAFKNITVLTYMFEGSTLKALFDINKMSYYTKSIPKKGLTLFDFDVIAQETGYLVDKFVDKGTQFKELIEIENSAGLNIFGKSNILSASWYKNKKAQERSLLGNNTRKFFRSKCKAVVDECLYTTFKDSYSEVKVNGYTSAFVPMNIRSTNKYAHKKYGAYLVNRFLSPVIKRFVDEKGSGIDEDVFALSEMIQWVWRMRIRNGEDVKLYIPSERMRNLLKDWLNK
ncbi:MAG: DEAD/DEAH box helicase family protein [Cetobacterium sp.]